MKNIRKVAFTLVMTGILVFPSISSAQSVSDLQAQIQALLAQVKQLQQQIAQVQGSSQQWCHTFNKNLKIEDSNSEVQNLSSALAKEGILDEKYAAKNDFDEIVAAAVTGFQEKYKNEILTPVGLSNGTGYAGPSTRKKLNQLYGCGGIAKPTQPTEPTTPRTTPPLQQSLTASPTYGAAPLTVKFSAMGVVADMDFGDGTGGEISNACIEAVTSCESTAYHQYTSAGTYIVKMKRRNSGEILGTVKITVTGSNSNLSAPVVNGIEGPASVIAGQIGKWTVNASVPNQPGAQLSYSVQWGDEAYGASSFASGQVSQSLQTSATFTHIYSYNGNYKPKFTVTNSTGSASAEMTVSVGAQPITSFSEQVKCVFNGATTEQKCYTATDNSSPYYGLGCTGTNGNACVVDLKGNKGDSITWKSSCGGYAYTTMDGQSEYANFSCNTTSSGITVTAPNGGEQIALDQPYFIRWIQKGLERVSIALYRNDQWQEWIAKDAYEGGLSTDPSQKTRTWTPSSATGLSELGNVFKIYITGQRADGQGYVDDKSDAPFGFVSNTTSVNITAKPSSGTLTTLSGSPTLWVETNVSGYAPQGNEIVDFGDGSRYALGYTTTTNNRHDYHTPGVYTVKLMSGTQVIASTQVTVTASPTATLTASPTSGNAPLAVTFSFTTTPGSLGTLSFNFGDGTTGATTPTGVGCSTDSCPRYGGADHTYTSAGTYTAKLILPRHDECVGALCTMYAETVLGTATVTVTSTPTPVPTATINANSLTVTAGTSATISGTASGVNTIYLTVAYPNGNISSIPLSVVNGQWSATGMDIPSGSTTATVTVRANNSSGLILTTGTLIIIGTPAPVVTCTKGDVDSDGAISRFDSGLVLKQVAGLLTLTNAQRIVADINGDGRVDLPDSIDILRYVARQITIFPACPAGTTGLPVVVKPNPTLTVSASPSTITSGGQSTITWSSANTTSCNLSSANQVSSRVQSNASQIVSPSTTTTYTVNCNDDFGAQVSRSVTITVTPAPAGICSIGDTDSDGRISASDQTKILKYVVGLPVTFTDTERSRADVDGDGLVNLNDSINIGKYIAGIITAFPACAVGTIGLPISAAQTSSTASVDIKVNGSDGPLTLADNQPITVSLTTNNINLSSCTIFNVRGASGTPGESTHVPMIGNYNQYSFYSYVPSSSVNVSVQCTGTDGSSQSDFVSVVNPGPAASIQDNNSANLANMLQSMTAILQNMLQSLR